MQEDSHNVGPVCNRTSQDQSHDRPQSVGLQTRPTEDAPFRGLDRKSPIAAYSRHMPHWRQDGVFYFVTFRLADSIPRTVLEEWAEQDRVWLAARGITEALPEPERQARYAALPETERRAFERDLAHRLFVELDRCHGSCLLRQAAVAGLVSQAIRFHHGTRIDCGDYVVMPNHVHWLLRPHPGEALESILHSVKRFSASQINRHVERSGTLWQRESYDHIVRDEPEFERIRSYIEQNPKKANLKSGEYVYYRAET